MREDTDDRRRDIRQCEVRIPVSRFTVHGGVVIRLVHGGWVDMLQIQLLTGRGVGHNVRGFFCHLMEQIAFAVDAVAIVAVSTTALSPSVSKHHKTSSQKKT